MTVRTLTNPRDPPPPLPPAEERELIDAHIAARGVTRIPAGAISVPSDREAFSRGRGCRGRRRVADPLASRRRIAALDEEKS